MAQKFPEHLTVDFLVILSSQDASVELWMDWLSGVDGGMSGALSARREGADLLVKPTGDLPTRRLRAVDPWILDRIDRGPATLVLCGPSGVLSRRLMEPERPRQPA